ncbi:MULTISPECIES: DEAD/DEAH box helicase family protein [unclassified Bartonella]|uniref:DEAD/DEAH box helicase family protein n=1 Tax=unclassified Bartonella TaxID=2645622 RepID=UPI0035CFC6ED
MDEDFFSSLYQSAISQNIQIERDKKSPRPYQSEILQDIISGFSSSDRGKLIAACGIGKTLIAL